MRVSSHGGLFGFIARLGRPPAIDSDADLLDRFVRTADETAFAGIVRRHGLMVLSVCRRRLRWDADAEDAFQAVFLALAKSARSIGRRDSLPGWLYRVAYLVSLKAAGQRARHPVTTLPTTEVPMPDPPTPSWETEELKAIIDAELAGLPDKFRAVVVLCLIEGRTNAEASTVLGIPVGTVDSRLSAARKKLCAKLTRRGVAVGVGTTLGQLLGGPLTAADEPGIQELVSNTIPAVLAEAVGAGGGSLSPAVMDLARGVASMTTTKLRLLASLGIALGILGGSAAGIYFATAADPPKPSGKQIAKTADTPLADKSLPAEKPPVTTETPEVDPDLLLKPSKVEVGGDGSITLGDLFEAIETRTDLIVRIDVAAFRRLGAFAMNEAGNVDPEEFLKQVYATKAILPRRADKLPLRDVLADALAQIRFAHPCTYQIRGGQILIVPAYVPPLPPGVNPLEMRDQEDVVPTITQQTIQEQIYGGVVNVSADRKPLATILNDLRKQTGANIVLDPRCETAEKKAVITVTLSDVRLYDALRVIADMAELKMVYAGNVYYVTTAINAKAFQPAPPPRPTFYGGLGGGPGQPIPQPKIPQPDK